MINRLATGSVWTPVSFVRRWNGTAWVDVSFVRRWDGTAWVQVWPLTSTLVVTTNKASVAGSYSCIDAPNGPSICPVLQTVSSDSVTVTSSGGSGAGPTFAWTFLSGNTGISVSNPTAATVTFSGVVGRRQLRDAVWRCAVTRGTDTEVVDVAISLSYDYSREGEIVP